MKILNNQNLLDLNESQLLKQYNILAKHLTKFNEIEGPRVGDYVKLKDGNYKRFCSQWIDGFQVTPTETSGSFNIDSGACCYSGTLEPSVKKEKIKFTWTYKLGRVWFFKDGIPAAHQGIDAEIPLRVYELID